MMEHLHNNIKAFLEKSDQERIAKIQGYRWIGYTQAVKITNKLEDLLNQPRILRMPNLLLVSETNNGKTELVVQFQNKHKAVINPEDNSLFAPVFYIQAPPKPDERRFYNNILDKLYTPYRFNDRVEKKQQQVISILDKIQTKILIIDEIHNVLAGNMTAQRSFLNVLKYLANELQIVIVAVGTQDAFNAINSDPQLANRFEPMVLPKWQYNREYLQLISSFEYLIPLKNPSKLIEESKALKILSKSEGTIGEISTIIKKAAILAIENGSERITEKIIDDIEYISPSERKKQIDLVR